MSSKDSNGFFGALISLWNPIHFHLTPFLTSSSIFLEGFSLEWNKPIQVLNVYGPYQDRQSFWERVANDGLLPDEHLVIGGDINLTLSATEVWGGRASLDPLSYFFNELFIASNLTKIQQVVLRPTWTNESCGNEGIAKRLY